MANRFIQPSYTYSHQVNKPTCSDQTAHKTRPTDTQLGRSTAEQEVYLTSLRVSIPEIAAVWINKAQIKQYS
ncbi:hypothetical protein ACTXT7_004136 [Hymenolepis weldensis]